MEVVRGVSYKVSVARFSHEELTGYDPETLHPGAGEEDARRFYSLVLDRMERLVADEMLRERLGGPRGPGFVIRGSARFLGDPPAPELSVQKSESDGRAWGPTYHLPHPVRVSYDMVALVPGGRLRGRIKQLLTRPSREVIMLVVEVSTEDNLPESPDEFAFTGIITVTPGIIPLIAKNYPDLLNPALAVGVAVDVVVRFANLAADTVSLVFAFDEEVHAEDAVYRGLFPVGDDDAEEGAGGDSDAEADADADAAAPDLAIMELEVAASEDDADADADAPSDRDPSSTEDEDEDEDELVEEAVGGEEEEGEEAAAGGRRGSP